VRLSLVVSLVFFAELGLASGDPARASMRLHTDIPPESLGLALRSLADQRSFQIVFATQDVARIHTEGAVGEFTSEEALKRLLKGTGLTYRYLDEKTVTLIPEPSTIPQALDSDWKHDQRSNETPPKEVGKSSSRDFRVAQVDQGAAARAAAVGLQAPQNAPSDQIGEQLEEIIVTAQKREERLLETPQSVSVLTTDQLTALGAQQFRDFANTVPGLTFSTAGAGYTQVSLRGVTLGQDTSPTVGIYVDDVPFGSSTGFAQGAQLALDVGLFDIDRIEVLRGPQGTLYGASTMGGLIKYVSKQPDPTSFFATTQTGIAFTQSGGVGYNAAAAVNAPVVSDSVALRASIFESHDGGYIDNIALGRKDVNRSDIYGARLDLLIKPTDQLTIHLGGFVQNISREGNATADYTLSGAPEYGSSLDQYRLVTEPFHQQFRLGDITVGYDFGLATLTSISSYQTQKTHTDTDYSLAFDLLGPFGSVGVPEWVSTDKFTQEVRLASNGVHTVDWLVGGFYTHESSQNIQAFELRDLAGNPVPNNLYYFAGPTSYQEYAGFGDATYHLSKSFDVTGGIRIAHNSQRFTQYAFGFLTDEPERGSAENVVTYLADARYHFTDTVIGYVRYATGYRPGGPNFVANDPVTGKPLAPATFEADRLKSYEGGVKAESADRRYSVDLDGYYINWSNIQVLTTADNFSVYANAKGGAGIPGAELSLTGRPMDALTARASFAYNDAHLKQDGPVGVGGFAGERLPNVAQFTAAGTLDYTILTGGPRPTIGATIRYVSNRDSSFANGPTPQYYLPAYTAFDLRGSVTLAAGDTTNVQLQLFLHNLFDERGQLSATTNLAFPPATNVPAEVTLIQPRTVGINITTNF
jgi:iron complex outermembrane recepter protein